jgi:perosamine synthetase
MQAVMDVLTSHSWSMFTSREVERFEAEFASYVGARWAVLLNSCTSAIHATLLALEIGPASHVAVPAYTYIATAMPVVAANATPIFVDSAPADPSLDVSSLRRAATAHSLHAVVVAHLFGAGALYEQLGIVAAEHGMAVIHDCAQLLGNRSLTAALCHQGPCCFSLGESKLLRIGEGGVAATNSDEVAERIRLVRHEGELWLRHGKSRMSGRLPNVQDVLSHLASVRIGGNYRPLAIAAALARQQLLVIDEYLQKTRRNAGILLEHLNELDDITLPTDEGRTWWTFPIVVNKDVERSLVIAALLAEGVPVGVHFPRLISDHPIMAKHLSDGAPSVPNARAFAERHIVLPIYPALDESHMLLIARAMRKVLRDGREELMSSCDRARRFLEESRIAELSSGLFFFLDK